jgi:hypothetical protein
MQGHPQLDAETSEWVDNIWEMTRGGKSENRIPKGPSSGRMGGFPAKTLSAVPENIDIALGLHSETSHISESPSVFASTRHGDFPPTDTGSSGENGVCSTDFRSPVRKRLK